MLVFLAAALLALQILPGHPSARALTAWSPLMSLLGGLAARAFSVWMLLGIPVLVLGWFRCRWFCRYVCPMGFAAEAIGRLNPKARGRFARLPNIGRLLLLGMVGGALLGYPLFMWLDPLALFTGFFSGWRLPLAASSFVLVLGFLGILGISLVRPNAWCHRLCPLGAAQDLLMAARRQWRFRRESASADAFQLALTRRDFLGVAAGGAAALLMRRVGALPPPVRPPGARPEDQFTGLCARCGACIRACPSRVIRPDFGKSGLAGLLTPVLDYSEAYCFEYCHECTQVCPTGAIEKLLLESKRHRAIGLAEVDRDTCLAWHDRQYCMVCQEFCPYLAINSVVHRGVNCPVVKPDMCRGCGACHVHCPARPDKAIVVRGLAQRPARPLADIL